MHIHVVLWVISGCWDAFFMDSQNLIQCLSTGLSHSHRPMCHVVTSTSTKQYKQTTTFILFIDIILLLIWCNFYLFYFIPKLYSNFSRYALKEHEKGFFRIKVQMYWNNSFFLWPMNNANLDHILPKWLSNKLLCL